MNKINKIKKIALSSLFAGAFFSQAFAADDIEITIDDTVKATSDPYYVLDGYTGELGDVTVNITGGYFLDTATYFNRAGVFIGSSTLEDIEIETLTVNFDNSTSLYKDTMTSLIVGTMPSYNEPSTTAFTVTNGKYINVTGGQINGSLVSGGISRNYSNYTTTGGVHTTISGGAIIGDGLTSVDIKTYPGNTNGLYEGSVYGGDSLANDTTASIDYVTLDISECTISGFVVACGSDMSGHSVLTITGATNVLEDEPDTVVASIVNINDGATIMGGYVIGGVLNYRGDDGFNSVDASSITGNIYVNVTGGYIGNDDGVGYVIGGSYSTNPYEKSSSATYLTGDTYVTVTGGTNENLIVVGGGESYSFDSFGSSSVWQGVLNYQEINGDTNVLISGTTVGSVYGGSLVTETENVYNGTTYVSTLQNKITGDTSITLENATINNNVFAGGSLTIVNADSESYSTVEGNANITLLGSTTVLGLVSGQGENGATVEGTSTLNMGTADVAYTGSLNNVADFDIINVASGSNATVNGTISSSDALNISGDLTVNSTVYVNSITIAESASLTVNISESITFTNSAMTFSNSGTLNLYASLEATAGDTYTVFANGDVDIAKFVTFGGSYVDNTFTVGATDTSLSLVTSAEISIAGGGRVIVATSDTDDSTAVYMAFSSDASATVNAVIDASSNASFIAQYESDISASSETFLKSAAYAFDIELTEGTVLLSMYVGIEDYDVSQFTIYHSEDGIVWDTTSASNVTYDGEYVSFEVSGFSTFGYTVTAASSTPAVPEPSTYALIIGLCSLGFVAYRRRK